VNFAACFFDFDGVLADSVEVKTEAFRALYLPDGPEVADRVVAHHRDNGGMSRFDKFAVYEREFVGRPFDDARCQELAGRFSELVLAGVLAAPAIPGAEEFLRQAAAACPCFVVSATPEPEIRHIVTERALAPLLTEVTGAPTSKTENLARLLREHRLDPTACVFFGDAVSDYDAATACGVRFVGIAPGPGAALVRRHPEVERYPDFNSLGQAWGKTGQ
jgi:beta-phosphoglucomutase-like phosphatase (HAD superfamily)